MSDTVGLPVAIAAKMILSNEINKTGVLLPIEPEIYKPILKEMESFGVLFHEKEVEPVLYK